MKCAKYRRGEGRLTPRVLAMDDAVGVDGGGVDDLDVSGTDSRPVTMAGRAVIVEADEGGGCSEAWAGVDDRFSAR